MSFSMKERDCIKVKLVEAIGSSAGAKGFNASSYAHEQGISVQTVYRYLRQLEAEGRLIIERRGKTNAYSLADKSYSFEFALNEITEDRVWGEFIRPLLKELPETAHVNCNYAFTEMLNNAIEHSGGSLVTITVMDNSYRVLISISDNGIGIFTKIAGAMNLAEKRYAVLELAKGKFTTDPESHTGEGIFFSSKATDSFFISSDELIFVPLNPTAADNGIGSVLRDDKRPLPQKGSTIVFTLLYNRKQTAKELFDRFTEEPEHYGFTKTIVPVRLLEYGDDSALFTSRSQAKRLLVRFERFKHIELDFDGVGEIGQGFADEVFRVFANRHPEVTLYATHCSEQVMRMINRAKGNAANGGSK